MILGMTAFIHHQGTSESSIEAVPTKETKGHFNIRAAPSTTHCRRYEGRTINFLSQREIWSHVLLKALSLAPDHCSHPQ